MPSWLQEASRSTVPTYQKDVPGVVLINDQSVSVAADGMLTITQRYAVRILTGDGKGYAEGGAGYLQSSSKVKDIKGWLIRSDGTVKYYGKDKVLDVVSDADDIYNEYRIKSVDATDDAEVGAIFGYETVVEERPLFPQDRFGFQHRLPTLYARYTLALPSGWRATSVTFNHDEIKPTVTGGTYAWEMRNMDPIPPEPDGLSVVNLAPRIAINYFPTASSSAYDSWHDVSKWYTDLSAQSLTLDDTVAAKARELAAGAKTDFERISAIGAYVQSLRYISLDLGVAHGGGHRPRPATLVLQRGYGDCKDKANLMRTMLKALKIESHLVLIYSGDPTYVRAEWASPDQFNHCIIAVAIGPDTQAPTIVTNEKLGRLLIFDPTDPYTQLGDLPQHEQGSFALISAGADGDLVKMPTLPPAASKLERNAEIELGPTGAISGKIHQRSYGQSASFERAKVQLLSDSDYKTDLQRWLTSRVKGGSIVNSVPIDRKSNGEFDLDLDFSAPVYAQLMQGRLMMFKPAMVGRLDQFTRLEGKRVTPMMIDASSYNETIRIKLPAGFTVDEMPDADKIETPLGRYSSKYELAGDYLIFTRSLELNRSIVPASKYDDVGRFFSVVRGAESSPVVLIKK
ncbi:MAG TPA: DUF3857 domain-containing transglutaminase family protein [Pyrinomonadaceae bacterium]|nr:DUF3857 domain-containing transglutaminase family protein [Pyrinomonadaceae bacterium]